MRIWIAIATTTLLCFGLAAGAAPKEGKGKPEASQHGQHEPGMHENENSNAQGDEDATRGQDRAEERRSEAGEAHEQAGDHGKRGEHSHQGGGKKP